jgi:hypothetical protein
MLTSEFHTVYDQKIGDTTVTIESECPDDTKEDILDALLRLIKRDISGIDTE